MLLSLSDSSTYTVAMRWLATAACLLTLSVVGCSRQIPRFDADRAFADLVAQTRLGPRVPGSETHRRCGEWLRSQLAAQADSVWGQNFYGIDSTPMVNIIARYAPQAARRILIGAHWDTRPFADMDPDSAARTRSFDGANDGASGVAVLLEVARALRSQPPPVGVDLALFDGEDAGQGGETPGNWCLGSRYLAAHLPARYESAIVLDMVGDRDLHLPWEAYSMQLAPDVVRKVWGAARQLGEVAFIDAPGPSVFDDHMPFLMKGIHAVDIIDLDYPYWHTSQDTADKCSAASLAAVGRVLLATIYSE